MPRKISTPIPLIDPGDPVASAMAALLPVHGALTLEWLVDAASAAAERIVPARQALIFLEGEDGALRHAMPLSDARKRTVRQAIEALGPAGLTLTSSPASIPAIAESLDAGAPLLLPVGDLLGTSDAATAIDASFAGIAPMEGAGERIGAILVLGDEMNTHHLRLVAEHASCAAINLRNAGAIRDQVAVDVARSVFDRRKLEAELQRELTRAIRYRREVSICVIEATNLRLLRERFGASLTDGLVEALGESLARHAREIDLIGAFKDSGYTMVLAEASASGAEAAARRLRSEVDGLTLQAPESVPGLELHLAVGWATCPADGSTVEALFTAAEQRMYQQAA